MPRYRIGVIGHTGRGNYGHGIDVVWKDMPDCEIVAVADPHEKGRAEAAGRLGAAKAYADYRAMLDEAKPDVVSICPRWVDQHRDMALACAERGIHMYMEKPMCRSPAEADEIAAACEKRGVKLAIAFQTRYSPKLPVLRSLIAEGKLGELVEIRARGKEDHRGGGEDLWVLGSHLMNLMHYFGGEPRWCFGRALKDGRPVAKGDVQEGSEGIGPLAGDRVDAMYGLDDGATGYFSSRKRGGPGGGSGQRFALKIFGTAGVLDIVTGYLPAVYYLPAPQWSTARSSARWAPVSSAGIGKPEPIADGSHHAGNLAACKDLLAAIAEDRQPEASVYEGRTTVEMITAVFASHAAGGPVEMPLEKRGNPLESLGRTG